VSCRVYLGNRGVDHIHITPLFLGTARTRSWCLVTPYQHHHARYNSLSRLV
jgi:hypothetical protein